jgi:hypothetical protein
VCLSALCELLKMKPTFQVRISTDVDPLAKSHIGFGSYVVYHPGHFLGKNGTQLQTEASEAIGVEVTIGRTENRELTSGQGFG